MQTAEESARTLEKAVLKTTDGLFIVLFSIVYFSETLIRASEKRFWYDELCTLYICRLPTLKDAWLAVLHGADYNPPFFYVIQRTSMALFGDGEIAMRLPQMLAFWILCVCLFLVVERKAGTLGGVAAMTLPLLTGAYFYAYDARPHGIVLGFCGLAVLCWQRLEEQPRSKRWLLGFALALQAAFLTHCYAILLVIPFAVIEIVRAARSKRINWRMWIALAAPAVIAVVSFVPLLGSFRQNLQSGGFNALFSASFPQFPVFYKLLFSRSILVLSLIVVVFAFERSGFLAKRDTESLSRYRFSFWDLLLILGFLGMPAYGLLLARIMHGPFIGRYFMSAVVGVCVAVGLGIGMRPRNRGASAIAGVIVLLAMLDAGMAIWDRAHGVGEDLVEPSTKKVVNTAPHDDLANDPLIKSASHSLPIATSDMFDFLYLVHYRPTESSRFFQVVPSKKSLDYVTMHPVLEWCRVQCNREFTYGDFLQQHPDFLFYSRPGSNSFLKQITAAGAQIRSMKFDGDAHYLAEVHMPRKVVP
jgi:Dolichyl-phosphate-mannose-protein mannosyltransferase